MNAAADLFAMVLLIRPSKRLVLHEHMGRATQQFALETVSYTHLTLPTIYSV